MATAGRGRLRHADARATHNSTARSPTSSCPARADAAAAGAGAAAADPTPLVPGPPIVANATAAGTPSPLANLVVTKSATPGRVIVGSKVRYRVTVRNRGPATARAVTIAERQAYNNRMLALEASKGRCRGTPPRFMRHRQPRRGPAPERPRKA